jgi:PAS domain S-box-containing protein
MNKDKLLSSDDLIEILLTAQSALAVYSSENLIIEAATDAMLTFWGRDRSIIGLPLATALPELAGQRFLAELHSVMLSGVTVTGKSVPAELMIGGKLQTSYYDYQFRALQKAGGEIYCVLHTSTDVTDKVLAKEAVRKLDEEQLLNQKLSAAAESATYRLEAMVMNTPIAMTILKGQNLVVEIANNPMLKVWRRTLDQVIGRGLVDIFPELKGQPNPGRMRKVMQNGKRFTLPETEVILGTVDGKLKKHYASFSYDPIVEQDGTIQSILVTVIDITHEVSNRHELEHSREKLLVATEDLAEANLRLNMAMEASSLGMAEANFTTGQMISTEQFKRNYGRSADEEFTYAQLFECMLPEYREEVAGKVKAAVENFTIYEAEYEIQWPDGTRHWISAHGIPRYEDGIADRIVGVSRLITEQKNAEQQKDDFLSVASHELKTPITVLQGNLQLLQRIKDQPGHQMLPKLIESANKGMEKISVLVDDLLNIKRFTTSKLDLAKKTFNVKELLRNASPAVLAGNEYDFRIEGDPELMLVADEHRIEQVVINFINNAVKYAPQSKIILVQFVRQKDEVKISVTDRGPGIPAEQIPKLFTRYWRADHGGSNYTGLGIGLYICAEIIERHGGRIGAESEIGKGSTFWFTVPIG